MKLFQFLALVASIFAFTLASPVADEAETLQYEYIVVGSGAGGGPLACRLAMAGHTTLLIESGNDQAGNINISVPAYQGVVTNDPKIRWDMFVNHYQNQSRAMLDPKFTWEVSPFVYHVGPNPPPGATPLGILYPRAGTLGGCVTHNALIWITPHASDWNNIATITGDSTWEATNMDQYLDKVYEWLPVKPVSPAILLNDLKLVQHIAGAAEVMGEGPPLIGTAAALAVTLTVDPNSRINPNRDSTEGLFQVPLTMKLGTRTSVRDFIDNTVASGYPLTVRQNCHVTKINFDTSTPPIATGVSFLDGNSLFRASPLSGGTGTPGSATVTKEVIISAGTYNTPQLLKLSGIGPAAELESFGIPVINNLPGIGTNMQDRYEIPVNVVHGSDFSILNGCTFDGKPHDTCLTTWENNPHVFDARGTYESDGIAAAMIQRSNYAANTDADLFIFGGPVDFTGYFPDWNDAIVSDHKHFTWGTLKAHTRNTAGTVQLRSANALDPAVINFNYFDTGTTAGGADQLDLDAMVQGLNQSRAAYKAYNDYAILGGDSFVETEPGPSVQSTADIENYIKERAWGHHASCSCPIGADDNPNAVLDSQFRVRGVQNLRVVDASVFPAIPGVFIQSPIMMVSEKAADVILNG
ncbi:alcohol oxidase [Mollisia scopiformis]|uniref:Alcohol oxidase n=1 Tax=Mollisia scopiformis TaxID=149040 RepID=A0A132B7T9_MOLSC|nr:alcohol oxidase [Mollisia scopiformis]KUJ07747.1 alcohol oxidase [Mollisia scopiformis]